DATKRLLYAQLWPTETTAAVVAALHAVCTAWGLPIALYTDRAGWAFYTPQAGGPVDRRHPTQVGRALAHLGIDHIGAYSPQARGRGERLNRTVQGRLVNELDLAGITTREAANAYLLARFIPDDLPRQVAKQPGRRTCAGLRVTVRRDIHGQLSVWHGARCFGRYDGQGGPLPLARLQHARAHSAQDRRSPSPPIPRIPRLKRRTGPRLPTGPRT
ncbi:MAG: hypothetical protein ACRDJN_06650, partial [Chloroflexota bacterium]